MLTHIVRPGQGTQMTFCQGRLLASDSVSQQEKEEFDDDPI